MKSWMRFTLAVLTLIAAVAVLNPAFAQNPFTLFQWGASIDTSSGTKSANTLRVTLATDQVQLTNKLLVTPDSVALPANQSVNVNQLAGTTTSVNSGTKDAGTLRVVIATDQVQLTNKLLVTPDSVALPANQSVNVAQVNGVTTLMGNGITGTGSQRVTIASDNTAFSVNAAQSGTWTVQPGNTANSTAWLTTDSATSNTGSAVPAKAGYAGGNGSGNLTGLTVCDTQKNVSVTANTTLITGTTAKHVYICHIDLVVAAATNVVIVSGTGTVCATGIAGIFGGTTAATGWNFAANGGIAAGAGLGWVGRTVATGDNVCILVSAANQTSGNITYTVY